ncbi:unnamed protein product, partial [Rotaria magnacalcarata]
MDVDIASIEEKQLQEAFESTTKNTISSFEILNPSTYLINAEDK